MNPVTPPRGYYDPPEEREHYKTCPEHPDYEADDDERIVCRCDMIDAGLVWDAEDREFQAWRDRGLGV